MKFDFNKLLWFNDGMFMLAIFVSISFINVADVGIKMLICSIIGILIHPTLILESKLRKTPPKDKHNNQSPKVEEN